MKSAVVRITLSLLFIIILFISNSSQSIAEQRTALVIGNSNYHFGSLKNPVNDATDMANALRKAGFTVTLKRNANMQEMIESIEEFGNSLKRGGVGLFYFPVTAFKWAVPIISCRSMRGSTKNRTCAFRLLMRAGSLRKWKTPTTAST